MHLRSACPQFRGRLPPGAPDPEEGADEDGDGGPTVFAVWHRWLALEQLLADCEEANKTALARLLLKQYSSITWQLQAMGCPGPPWHSSEPPWQSPSACTLGALESTIGHLEAAAGIAGLVKAVLVLLHENDVLRQPPQPPQSSPVAGFSPVVFMYSGQGTAFVGMGHELFDAEPVSRSALTECTALMDAQLPTPLLSVMHPAIGGGGVQRVVFAGCDFCVAVCASSSQHPGPSRNTGFGLSRRSACTLQHIGFGRNACTLQHSHIGFCVQKACTLRVSRIGFGKRIACTLQSGRSGFGRRNACTLQHRHIAPQPPPSSDDSAYDMSPSWEPAVGKSNNGYSHALMFDVKDPVSVVSCVLAEDQQGVASAFVLVVGLTSRSVFFCFRPKESIKSFQCRLAETVGAPAGSFWLKVAGRWVGPGCVGDWMEIESWVSVVWRGIGEQGPQT